MIDIVSSYFSKNAADRTGSLCEDCFYEYVPKSLNLVVLVQEMIILI